MDVEFFFDPVCTWSWVASRWLNEVAPWRGLQVSWRSFSKLIGLGTQGLRDWDLTSRTASHRALRVIEAVRVDHPDAIQRLYEAMIARAMVEHAKIQPLFSDLPATLKAAGLDARYAGVAYDERWDEAIRKSMADVYAVVGEGARTPMTVRCRAPIAAIALMCALILACEPTSRTRSRRSCSSMRVPMAWRFSAPTSLPRKRYRSRQSSSRSR